MSLAQGFGLFGLGLGAGVGLAAAAALLGLVVFAGVDELRRRLRALPARRRGPGRPFVAAPAWRRIAAEQRHVEGWRYHGRRRASGRLALGWSS